MNILYFFFACLLSYRYLSIYVTYNSYLELKLSMNILYFFFVHLFSYLYLSIYVYVIYNFHLELKLSMNFCIPNKNWNYQWIFCISFLLAYFPISIYLFMFMSLIIPI